MRSFSKIFFCALLALILLAMWGCDRLKSDVTENRLPDVWFINIPPDSTTFNYAPLVRWYGHDPDGLIKAYQFHDDTSQAALDAYYAMATNPRALTNLALSHPEYDWRTTYNTQDTIYLRRSEHDTLTTHVFMIRAVDDQDGMSLVKGRRFARTNTPPNTPKVKWSQDITLATPFDYQEIYHVPDTLFWGDTLSNIYPGIGFLWQGKDPDSRDLNIIPLQFSWLLVNESTHDTMPHPIYDDSSRVVDYAIGWSEWNDAAQVAFTAASARHYRPNFVLDGQYRFFLRVRDDGLTMSDTMAQATFFAYSTKFSSPDIAERRQLLIIDWNKHATPSERNLGLADDQAILDFYHNAIPEGLRLAEQVRLALYNNPHSFYGYIPEPITVDTAWYSDKVLTSENRVPYELIRNYKWVWVINDNPPVNPPAEDMMAPRIKVLEDYMKVGGQVMISGRRLFTGSFNLSLCGPLASGTSPTAPPYFFSIYERLSSICAKPRYQLNQGQVADFSGATTTQPYWPTLEVDTVKARDLNFRNEHFLSLPEIDYFGRPQAATSTEYSTTLYNYVSSTASSSWDTTNIDCEVDSVLTTPSRVVLYPAPGHSRILNVSRIFNRTKNVYGEFMRIDREVLPNGLLNRWRIIASTPAIGPNSKWLDSDVLEVDYTYVPIEPSHDQPIASNYTRLQGIATFDQTTGAFRYEGHTRFRSSVFVFPLYFMKNDEPYTLLPGITGSPVAAIIAYQALFFNSPKLTVVESRGGLVDAVKRFNEPLRSMAVQR